MNSAAFFSFPDQSIAITRILTASQHATRLPAL
jgi:hypothetical protein